MSVLSAFILLACAALILDAVKRWSSKRRYPGLYARPPGPPPSGLITGHLWDMPTKKPWITFTEWAKSYGDIVHLEICGQHIFILSSAETANDLLERRSRIYSDRPAIEWEAMERIGWGFATSLRRHDKDWQKQRRIFQQHFRPDAVAKLVPAMQQCLGIFLRNLLESPIEVFKHVTLLTGSLTLSIMYGIKINSNDHELLAISRAAMDSLDEISMSEIFILRWCPFIDIFPSWLPILGPIKEHVHKTRTTVRAMREEPFIYAQKNEKNDSDLEQGLASQMARMGQLSDAKDVAATTYAGSADTSLSTITTFIIAMVQNPEFQDKAQREIDEVVGRARLPSLDDRRALPFLEAIYRELLRWRPALPLGLAHAVTEDDIYRDYFIPKGSTIYSNIWGMTRDEGVYFRPDEFNPERFFDKEGNLNDDDTILAFGFGRRVCVGRHFAEATVWLTIASMLACFNIGKEKTADGVEVDLHAFYSDRWFFSHPLPFQCSITPRHADVESLFP